MARRATATSAFGVSRRESHDSSAFYRRFVPPVLSPDGDVHPEKALDRFVCGDARAMDAVPDASVALVVTSPPYFAGKEYEEALGEGGTPASYLEYLDLLRDVFSECVRKLEPGGRLAVNVANLGRRPYRSLSADVIAILQDDLRMLLRGEIIWLKQKGSSGSCAWGSFQHPANPVLRDLTERVIVASKGRFDRALPAPERARRGLPSEPTITRDEFMESTLDVWEIPPESATRVGHPAPFPVELALRLIELHTYRGDLVLDPFVGSGTVAVAAVRSGRHYVGYDLDEGYLAIAEARVEEERHRCAPTPPDLSADRDFARALDEGRSAKELARALLEEAGFTRIEEAPSPAKNVRVTFRAHDLDGRPWLFEVCGGFSRHRAGLRRTDLLWKAMGTAALLAQTSAEPYVVLSPGSPPAGGAGGEALRQLTGPGRPIRAVVDLLDARALATLGELCGQPSDGTPLLNVRDAVHNARTPPFG